ncbi:MAG: CPBP family intramembrane metalloprotease, partial [Anaerolineae bacterium]|nr:CPBP family intramembrane metalloprotease [Anaerolineae bacterium]
MDATLADLDRQHRQPLARRLDLWLTVLGMLGLVVFLLLYERAFPSAALELELSRGQIAQQAEAYMAARGHELTGYERAITFGESWTASIYLQQTLGIPATNALVKEERLPLWLWEVRWFRPLQKEEFRLTLMPDGAVVALSHLLLEDAPGAALSQEQARTLARAYLAEDRGWDLSRWEEIKASTDVKPGGRADHHFEWKRSDWAVGKSELRLAVDVQGDAVDGYGHWLKPPEDWQRRFSEQRNRAGFISNLCYYVSVGLFSLVALVCFWLGHRRGVFRWHQGVKVGLIVAAVSLLADLNWLPLSKAWYGTTQAYAMFWANQLIGVLYSAGFALVSFTVLWAGGRYFASKVWPAEDKILPRSEDRWIALSASAWRGLMLAGAGAGYLVLFYLVATQLLGGWSPMDVPSVNLYATPLPFASALMVGVLPAVSEEILSRLVGVGLLLALTRRRWLAVVVPGLLWAFAHLSYVRDPIYFRGLELALEAVLYGLIFLRYGLATTIVAHLAWNSFGTALPMLRSGQPYLMANGALVVVGLLALLVPGALRWLRRRREGVGPTPTLEIRSAVRDDLPGLTKLDNAADWSAWLADPAARVLSLRVGGRLVGAAAGRLDEEQTGHVLALCVAPD